MNNKKAQISIIAIFLAFTVGFFGLFLILPKSEYSPSEKRYLAKAPEVSLDSFFAGELTNALEGGENGGYIPDHFPFRTCFVGVNAYWNLLTGTTASNGYYYGDDGYIITKPADSNRAEKNLELINRFSATLDEVGLMVVPSAGYMLDSKLPKAHADYPDEQVYEYIYENKADNIRFYGLCEDFGDHVVSDEQIFYKTDHHWTSLGAYTAYGRFCEDKGVAYTDKDAYTVSTYEAFYGTTYSSSGYFLNDPDTLEIWENKAISDSIKVTITEGAVTETFDSMYFDSHLSEDDMYPVFLDGNHALVTIENSKAKSDDTILIIKDSFAHCAAPFFAENYSKVIMVDLRYYKLPVSDIINSESVDEVLFLYGMNNFCTDTNLGYLG